MARPIQGLEDKMALYYSHPGSRGKPKLVPPKILKSEVQISLERSIAQGSTISITTRDPERLLQRAGFYTRDGVADFELDDLWFRCCHFNKNADEYTLEAEDREVTMMREYKGPFKLSAAQKVNPRALYIRSLVRKAIPHAKFFCPELGVKPKVLPAKETEHQKKAKFKKGASKKDLKIEGQTADADQHHNIETLLAACDRHNAPFIVRVAIICAGIGESTLHTITTANSAGYWGVLQGGSGQHGSQANFPNPRDSAGMAESFLLGGRGFQAGGALHLYQSGNHDPGDIATKVEASGEPAYFYGKHRADAEAIVNIVGHGEAASSGETESEYTPQRFFQLPQSENKEGNEPEGAFENACSYAEEVLWRFFCSSGQMNFVSDPYLEKSKPRMEIDEGTTGVEDIKFTIDRREKKNPPQLEIDARASLWYAPPGTAVVVGQKQGKEIHEGVWLVSTVQRKDITDSPVTITLERPKNPLAERALSKVKRSKKETAASTEPSQPAGKETPDGGHNAGPVSKAEGDGTEQVRYNCGYIAHLKLPYVWGGGHGSSFGPTAGVSNEKVVLSGFGEQGVGRVGLDCSGAVSWALGAGKAHMLDHPYDTVGLEYWGKPGEGQWFTVWVRSSPDGHTFIEFKPRGSFPRQVFVFHGPTGKIESGWGSESHAASTGNWKPRHWPGC